MRLPSIVFVALACSACDPKLKDVLKKNEALIAETQQKFIKVNTLVTVAPLPAPSAQCKPPQPLHQELDGSHDTDVVGYQELRRGGELRESDAGWDEIPVFAKSPLASLLTHVHPSFKKYRNPEMKVGKPWRSEFEQAAKTKYLVVVRTRDIDREAGRAVVDVHLIDWNDPKILCSISEPLFVEGGQGVSNYNVVRRNRKTGAERVVRSGSNDNFWEALFRESDAKLKPRLKQELGVKIDRERE